MPEVFNNMPSAIAPQFVQPPVFEENFPTAQYQPAIAAVKVSATLNSDAFENSQQTKQGPIKKLKNFISNARKAFATTGEYIKGTFRGITSGISFGAIVYTAGDIANRVRANAAKKANIETFKKVPNKLLAGLVFAGSIAINLWKSSLNANERRSDIEHRYEGHKQ